MEFLESPTNFYLGRHVNMQTGEEVHGDAVYYDSRDLTTHGIVVGMTGSGKTGLCISILEEAALDGIPAIVIDPKGDITNLLLAFPDLSAESFRSWINPNDAVRAGQSVDEFAISLAQSWKDGLADSGISPARVAELKNAVDYRIYTPGSDSGLPISILHSLRAPVEGWLGNEEASRERISGTVTALLSLIGLDVTPVEDREHILLSNIFEAAWKAGQDLTLESLILQTQRPPFSKMGVFDLETLFPEKDRFTLAKLLNNIIAAPQFQSWIKGEPLDIESLLFTPEGKPRVSIFYVAHLNDAERNFIVTLLLENMLSWMRSLQGTTSLRALLYIDEIFGMFPPYPFNPPTKAPMIRLLKQARAFGVGILLATQNPGDLDYKGLSNAGTWFIGKLQTDNDKKRILDGLDSVRDANSSLNVKSLDRLISNLGARQFIMHNVHEPNSPFLIHTRWAMSYLRGPITRDQIAQLMASEKAAPVAAPMQAAPVTQGYPAVAPVAPPAAPPPPAPVTYQQASPPRAPQAAVSQADDLPGGFSSMPPVLPSTVVQFYVPTEFTVERSVRNWEEKSGAAALSVETRKRLLYRPALLAQADVRFTDKATSTSESRTFAFVLPTLSRTGRVNWSENAVSPFDSARLEANPLTDSFYGEVPSALNDARLLKTLQADLINWIYQNASVKVLWNPGLKIRGRIGGSRREFLVEVQGVARQMRDAEADKVSLRYDKKLDTLEDRAEIKARQVGDKRAELDARKREELISAGESMLQLVRGRSYHTLSRISRMRRYTSTTSDRADLAQEQLKKIVEDMEATEKEVEQALQAVQDKWANMAADVQELSITPFKKDIHVDLFGIGWIPYWDVLVNNEQLILPASPQGARL